MQKKNLKEEVRDLLREEFQVPMTDKEFNKHWKKLSVRYAIQTSSLGIESFNIHEKARYIASVIATRVGMKNWKRTIKEGVRERLEIGDDMFNNVWDSLNSGDFLTPDHNPMEDQIDHLVDVIRSKITNNGDLGNEKSKQH